ncbi:MAG: peptide chain release factor N(5)-glutamine methyltransferase [Candidatus Acidiferrales bacterium]
MKADAINSMTAAMDIRSALKDAMALLRAVNVPSHALAAELLLMHTLCRDRAWIYAHPEFELDAAAAQKFSNLVAQRASGEPTQYLTGKQEFWGLEFEVTPAVLIPRPETEHIIEVALERIGAARESEPFRIGDIGTGSGCIAVALASEFPNAEIAATDISAAALEVAQRNAARHGVASRIHFTETNLLDAFAREAQRFDVIASNPPYIGRADAPTLEREVRAHEPEIALFAGDDGLTVYAPLIRDAAAVLRPGGLLILELGYNSLAPVRAWLESGDWKDIRVTNDLAGIPRVISAEHR